MTRKATTAALAALALCVLIFIYSMLHVERSVLAESIARSAFTSAPVRNLISGRWDVVCPISETARPEIVLTEAGYNGFQFSGAGNGRRSILLDGETGLVLINIASRTYALFLIFDRDRASVVPAVNASNSTACHEFSEAILVRDKASTDSWVYFTIKGAEG